MRIPLCYPKIHGCEEFWPAKCTVFNKEDGTLCAFYFNRKLGFYAFGTRRDKFDLNETGISEFTQEHPELKEVPAVFEHSYLHLKDNPFMKEYTEWSERSDSSGDVVFFAEFFGLNSFAGSHLKDDPKQLTLIDVKTDWGFVDPEKFCKDFGSIKHEGFSIPKVLFSGKYIGQIPVDVRNGKYDVKEGVVIKGLAHGLVCMAKVKTNSYMEKLKTEFRDEWRNYWE